MAKKNKNIGVTYIDDSTDDSLLRDLVKKVDSWYAYFGEHINRAENFLMFLYVDQWEPLIRANREALGKPTLQFNKILPILRGILGEQRDDSPQLSVIGVGENIDQNSVDLRSDLIRQIQYESNSDLQYQTVFKLMMEVGYGAARVYSDYENSETFNKCLKIAAIPDYQCAFFDPTAQEPDKSDGDFAGYYTTISRDHFKRMYPEVSDPQVSSNTNYFRWMTRESVTICHIYYKDYFDKTIVELSNGETLEKKDATDLIKTQEALYEDNTDALDLFGVEPLEIVNERVVKDHTIKCVKFVLNAVLEKTDWPGKTLPQVYFDGDSTIIRGERLPLPFIQDAIDTQRYINYLGSEMALQVLNSRSEKIMGTPSNFEGYEVMWRNPQQVQGALIANPDDETKQMPTFMDPPVFNPAILQAYQNSTNDLQQITGRYEEARGQQSNAMSGVAIAQRKESSNAPVNVYQDNLARGIRQLGKIVLECIPYVYDNERILMVRNVEGKGAVVKINEHAGFEYDDNGEMQDIIKNDMSMGEYDVETRVDGSFTAQLERQFDTFARFIAINPQTAGLVGDLMAAVSGLPNATKLEKRLETLVPPNILASERGEPPPPPPPPPPPDPMLMIAEKDLQIKDKKVTLDAINQAKKLNIDAQSKGINAMAAFAKAQAEIRKSDNDLKASVFSNIADMANTTAQSKEDQTIADAESRRATLDEQASTLKEMGI